jgi:hypothetical protein
MHHEENNFISLQHPIEEAMRNDFKFEVCANGVESCIAAQQGGADRVELCAGIPEGGTTPSYGEIRVARRMLTHTRLHVIIRPRGGDFLYSPLEIERMESDIDIARELGADGVVFGCLRNGRDHRHRRECPTDGTRQRHEHHFPPCIRLLLRCPIGDGRYHQSRIPTDSDFGPDAHGRTGHRHSKSLKRAS